MAGRCRDRGRGAHRGPRSDRIWGRPAHAYPGEGGRPLWVGPPPALTRRSPGVNVLLLILDGLSPRYVRRDITPTLSAMAEAGGWNRGGGVAVMPASTYPNHAT